MELYAKKIWSLILKSKIFIRTVILFPKLFWHTVRKNCSSDQEKCLKFEAKCQEFWDDKTNTFKQWNVGTISEAEC